MQITSIRYVGELEDEVIPSGLLLSSQEAACEVRQKEQLNLNPAMYLQNDRESLWALKGCLCMMKVVMEFNFKI